MCFIVRSTEKPEPRPNAVCLSAFNYSVVCSLFHFLYIYSFSLFVLLLTYCLFFNQLINQNPATTAIAAAPTTGFIGQGNVNIDPITRLTTAEEIYLDPTEKVVRRNQRTNRRLT